MRVLVILFCFNILLINYNFSSGAPQSNLDRPSRIVGGQPVNRGEISWQVSLQRLLMNGKTRHFCGGALIADSWVATAAHCTVGLRESEVVAVLGAWNLKEENPGYRVSKIIRNDYDDKTMKNDIALLKIDRERPHNKTHRERPHNYFSQRNILKQIPMERMIDVSGKECLISGWGRLSVDGDLPDILHAAKVSLLRDMECQEALQNTTYKEIFNSNVCAGGGDTDACQGDSGGPLVCCEDSKSYEKCSLTGITSWGIGCATPGIPGIYTEIAYYEEWINKIINTES